MKKRGIEKKMKPKWQRQEDSNQRSFVQWMGLFMIQNVFLLSPLDISMFWVTKYKGGQVSLMCVVSDFYLPSQTILNILYIRDNVYGEKGTPK